VLPLSLVAIFLDVHLPYMTGIGAATARELARRGFHVLAGVRRGTDADALRATNLEPIMLDITNEAEIAALVKRIAGYGKTRLGSDFLICVHLISFSLWVFDCWREAAQIYLLASLHSSTATDEGCGLSSCIWDRGVRSINRLRS
jgi:NAD(P)-dependent dehydrogenase (short-subunit alcohol dehydrogenase family)